MAIRVHGPAPGENFGNFNVTLDGTTKGAPIPSYKKSSILSGLPRITDGFDGDTLSVDTTGLTGPFTYDWRIVGGALKGGDAATLDTSGLMLMGEMIECAVTHAGGTNVSPAVQVYDGGMHGSMSSHSKDDAAIVALVPHNEVTHIAVADGNWTDPATWMGGKVPRDGAYALVPHGRTVTYDERGVYRLDRVRIDGTLTVTTAANTHTRMLVETMVCTRSGSFICGTSAQRMPASSSFTLTFSGMDYSANSPILTDLKASNFIDTLGWGRGFICQGLCRIWGREKTTWLKAAEEVNQGATSLTLASTPVGWDAGDEIIIGGTAVDYAIRGTFDVEDEIREITSIDGATVSWSADPRGGLTYPHKNQLAGSTRTDLYPVVAVRGGGNVIFQSEVTEPAYRRGHFAMVHHHSTTDIWSLNIIGLGRTDKGEFGAAIDTSKAPGSQLKIARPDAPNGYIEFTEVTPQANVISRYGLHMHHVGHNHETAGRPRPIVRDVYMEDIPGWGYVHHACDVDFFNCVGYDIFGAGMVGEAGNEVGAWKDCLMIGARPGPYPDDNLLSVPKNFDGAGNNTGDFGRFGYGYAMRGRAMRVVGCVANSVTWGFVFLHRPEDEVDKIVSPTVNPMRSYLDLKQVQQIVRSSFTDFSFVDYPINHLADLEMIATISGLFVTKTAPQQFHDVNVRFKRLKSWGFFASGLNVEYIGSYLFEDTDCVASGRGGQSEGIHVGGNTFQVGAVRTRSEGCTNSIIFTAVETQNAHNSHDLITPRYYHIGTEAIDCDAAIGGSPPPGGKPFSEVIVSDDDWNSIFADETTNPSLTYALEIGVTDGGVPSPHVTNADGGKVDQLTSGAEMVPKPFSGETIFPYYSGYRVQVYADKHGYYQYGGNNVVIVPMFISDRVTARAAKQTFMYRWTGSVFGKTDMGPANYSATPISGASDKTVTVTSDTAVVTSVVFGLSGGDGSTYTLDNNDILKPDHGVATLNTSTGEVTYTRDPGFVGTDEMTVFVKSGWQWATIKLYFLCGPGGAVTSPAVTANFAVADGGSQSIDVTLGDPPFCGGRFIRTVQYSNDAGATWRRLCHRWIKATHNIRVESNGKAITVGSYNVRIRYLTNYDFSTSSASGDASVTVS